MTLKQTMRPDDIEEPVPVEIVLNDRCVTIKQLVEEHCPVSQDLVRHWIRHEGLPVFRAGKHLGSKKAKILILLIEFYSWMCLRRQHRFDLLNDIPPEVRKAVDELKALGWV